MSIESWYDKKIIIYRPKNITGFKQQLLATGTIDSHIQRIERRDTLDAYGVQGAAWQGWVDPASDVKEGDTIEDQNGVKYSVIATNVLDSEFTMNNHMELIMIKYKANA